MRNSISIIIILILSLLASEAQAQEKERTRKSSSATEISSSQDTSKGEKIQVIYADLQRSIQTELGFDRYLEGNVQIIKDSSFFYNDTSRINDLFLKSWGDVSMIKSDSLEVYADSLVYEIDAEEADIYGSVYVIYRDQVLFSDYIHYDDKNDIAYYTDKAILKNGSVELKSKRGEFRTQEDLAIFSQTVSVKDTAFELYADSLLYNTALNKAIFQGPTDIILDSATVYCEGGYYLMDEKKGYFKDNAQYFGLKDTATADEIKADGVNNQVEMIGNAVYVGETTYAEGEYIRYNQETGEVEVRGDGYVKDGDQELRSDVIFYNKTTKKFSSEGRTNVASENSELIADNIQALDKNGIATGQVVFKDTLNGIRIDSETLEFDQGNASYNKAYSDGEKALLRSEFEDKDSMFISADTLFSFQQISHDTLSSMGPDSIEQISISSDTLDLLTAYYGVKIYNNSFQAVCDSLAFNTKDSILTLYKNPVMWSDTSQFQADTIMIYFAGNTVDRIELFPKSFISNSADEVFFNQVKGKRSIAYFTEGKIDSMNVKGNAQSIYYLMDEDNAYIGVNKTECTSMTFYFAETLQDIFFETEPTSKIFPMETTNHDAIKLEGFSWLSDLRPKDKTDISDKLREILPVEKPLE